jgi:sulfite reductase (ferredoxin)
VCLTAQQNLLLAGIAPKDRPELNRLLRTHGILAAAALPPVLRESMACPALPTCGQAVAESERVWPMVAHDIQTAWDAAGMQGEPLCVRLTGCANGCARPYTAEIGIVGQSVQLYSLYVGGSPLGTRLGELLCHGVPLREIAGVLTPLFVAFARERDCCERFGDWATRRGVVRLRAVRAEVEAGVEEAFV